MLEERWLLKTCRLVGADRFRFDFVLELYRIK